MTEEIEIGFMVFVADGTEGIGAVRQVSPSTLTVYVENAGEFVVPRSAVAGVHSQKIILDHRHLTKSLLLAIGHAHDGEDPSVAG